MSKRRIKLFISYSWDGAAHEEWVIHLANRLRGSGVDVLLDKYELKLGNDLISFMEKSVMKSDKVLLILTPNYKLRAEKRRGGVGHEFSIITSQFSKTRVDNTKYIPVLRSGTVAQSVPVNFGASLLLDMSVDSKFEENIEYLLREIYNKPKLIKPIIGDEPVFDAPTDSAKLICLDRKVLLKIEDATGSRAFCQDEMSFRVLEEITSYVDVFSSDTSLVTDIKTHPGNITGSNNDNGKLLVETTLDKTYTKGDILDYTSSCVYLDCHKEDTSYFSVWSEYKMEKLEMIVCFPINRKYKTFESYKKTLINDRKRLSISNPIEEITYLGLPALRLTLNAVGLHEKHFIDWSW